MPVAIKTYITYLQDRLKIDDSDFETNEKRKLAAEVRTLNVKAEIEEMKLKDLLSKMHRAEDVKALFTDILATTKNLLITLPSNISTKICDKLDLDLKKASAISEISEIIEGDVFKVLNELSEYEYDSERFKERAQERQGWTCEEDITEE